ncbi:hypothetical protein GCM10011499_39920 [Pelagibacterium lentulum]|uniref:Uncharacterized protein n=1 Tax=Pelagibacterium lentulum TaxID=2029865 RepID=A0A916RR04_9HYPH|nr:hypothetical protein GCM10011499_39920 [Pelagibacterium lentulum]
MLWNVSEATVQKTDNQPSVLGTGALTILCIYFRNNALPSTTTPYPQPDGGVRRLCT